MRDYSEKHCWQYDIRLKNIDLDLKEANFTENYTHNLTVNDFEYKHVVDTKEKQELKKFIERHGRQNVWHRLL